MRRLLLLAEIEPGIRPDQSDLGAGVSCLRTERKRARESGSENQLTDMECAPMVANQHDGNAVVHALLDLEEIYRAPLSLFYLQEHSYKEIANTLDLPMGTVMSRISRGKALLRKQLTDDAYQGISEREIA